MANGPTDYEDYFKRLHEERMRMFFRVQIADDGMEVGKDEMYEKYSEEEKY